MKLIHYKNISLTTCLVIIFWSITGCDLLPAKKGNKSILFTVQNEILDIDFHTRFILYKGDNTFTFKEGKENSILEKYKLVSNSKFELSNSELKVIPLEISYTTKEGKDYMVSGYSLDGKIKVNPTELTDSFFLYISLPYMKTLSNDGFSVDFFDKKFYNGENILLVNHVNVCKDKKSYYYAKYKTELLFSLAFIMIAFGIWGYSNMDRVEKYFKLRDAIKNYKKNKGTNSTVLAILSSLKLKKQNEIRVSFKGDNVLPKEDQVSVGEDGKKFTLYTAYTAFQPQNTLDLEKEIVFELNKSFSKIISNDVFSFVRGDKNNLNDVFFEIKYKTGNTKAIYTKIGEESATEGFTGIFIEWYIDIFVNGKKNKHIEIVSLPADTFTPRGKGISDIFREMAITSFIDLNNKLQESLK